MSFFFILLVLIIALLTHKIIKMKWGAKKLFQILPFYLPLLKNLRLNNYRT